MIKFGVNVRIQNWIWVFLTTSMVFAPPPMSVAIADQKKEDIHIMDDVVVTSTSKTKMLDTPASISVITASELEKIGAKNIIEALERIPGVYNTSASRTSLSIRGTRSSMAGGPVILVDGIAQKYGNYRREELDIIPVSQIERIEVLRSAGVVYGPGSSRGVINIITKKGQAQKPIEAKVSASHGSWETSSLSGSLNGRISQWDYYTDLTHFQTDGYEQEEETRTSGLLKLGYNLSTQTRIGLRGNWLSADHDTAFDLNKYEWQLKNYRDKIHFPQGEDDDDIVWHNTKEQDSALYALDFTHKGRQLFADGALSYTHYDEVYHDTKDIFYSATGRSRNNRGDIDDRDQDTYTASLSAGYAIDFNGVDYTPVLGLSYEDVSYSQRRTYPYDTDGTTDTDPYALDLCEKSYGLFLDNDFSFGDRWGLKIGNRIDQVDLTFENKEPWKFDTDETMWSWAVAPSYHYTPRANIYLSIGTSYWFPSPQYYFWSSDYGSPNNLPEDLKPEETITYELGYKHSPNKSFNIALTGFYSETQDKFAGFYEDGDYKGQKNTGDASTYGLEMEIDGKPLSWLGYRLSAAYLDAQWDSGTARIYDYPTNDRVVVDLDGQQVHGIPNFTGRVGLDFYPVEGLKASVDANYAGEYYLDYANRLSYPSKTTVDASINYSWTRYTFWVLGKNIFDEKVERAINSTGRLTEENGTPQNAYYVSDGAYFEAGLSVKF